MEELEQLSDNLVKAVTEVGVAQIELIQAVEKLEAENRGVFNTVDLLPNLFNSIDIAMQRATDIPTESTKLITAIETSLAEYKKGLADPEVYKKYAAQIQADREKIKELLIKIGNEL